MGKVSKKRLNINGTAKTQGRKRNGKAAKGSKKAIEPKKVFLYALGLAVAGGAGYILYDKIKKRKEDQSEDENSETIIINNNLPASTSSSGSFFDRLTSRNDNFPLKRGSRGSRVTILQQGLSRIIGLSAMNANGGIDGEFGPGTANALKTAGYPEIVDEAMFNKITGASSSLQLAFNPRDLAIQLYKASAAKDIATVVSILKQLKSASDYSAVNEYYKKQGFISKTIVTDLLDIAFKNDDTSKYEIKTELTRMGLKVDDSGRWSLSGIKFRDLITLRATVVTDSENRRIPVKRNTILGDEMNVANGMTWFRSIDNAILKVPTQDIKYT